MTNSGIKRQIGLTPSRNSEWPIVKFWYTQHAGRTIEEIIDKSPSFLEWAIKNFQNVTPRQAEYFTRRTGKIIPQEAIQDVTPYEYISSDPPELYEELCKPGAVLEKVLQKYRGVQLNLF